MYLYTKTQTNSF